MQLKKLSNSFISSKLSAADFDRYVLTPYMAIPVFIIWLILFFKEVHFDAHKAFEKYLLK